MNQRLIKLPTGRFGGPRLTRVGLAITTKPTTTPFADTTAASCGSSRSERFRAASVAEMTSALPRGLEEMASAGEGLGDFKIEPAGYYLFAYDCTEAYYRHTRSILESMLKGVVKQLAEWGLKPARPETRLVVVIMPNRQAFDAYDEMPDGVAAYYNGISNYVVLYEDDRLFDAAPEFALKQGSYIVAHEAIHQLLHNTGLQQRLSAWPAVDQRGSARVLLPAEGQLAAHQARRRPAPRPHRPLERGGHGQRPADVRPAADPLDRRERDPHRGRREQPDRARLQRRVGPDALPGGAQAEAVRRLPGRRAAEAPPVARHRAGRSAGPTRSS